MAQTEADAREEEERDRSWLDHERDQHDGSQWFSCEWCDDEETEDDDEDAVQTISDVFREDGRYTKAEEDVIWQREERRLRDLDDGIIWDDDH